MEHRKRNMMQHKMELSVLLRIAIANRKSAAFRANENYDTNVTKTLAAEAMESLKNCDLCTATAVQNKSTVWIY